MQANTSNEELKDVAGGALFDDANRKVLSQEKILPVEDGSTTRHTCVKCGREFEFAQWVNEKALPEKTAFCRECRNKKF